VLLLLLLESLLLMCMSTKY